jgi:hypothetical protein
MNIARFVSIEAALIWSSAHALHTDRYFYPLLNVWRDFFPGDLGKRLARTAVGETLSAEFAAGELIEPYNRVQVRNLPVASFRGRLPDGQPLTARLGRFYPRNLLSGVTEFFSEDRRPFRILALNDDQLTADFNHPYAEFSALIELQIRQELSKKEEHGGRSNDLAIDLTNHGPGMQATLPDLDTDFISGNPFARLDAEPDTLFYETPRLVQHLDTTAIGRVRELYRRFLSPRMKVLDLMSSWTSHLPENIDGLEVTGLGMNREELEHNPRLTERVIHDLNAEPKLPLHDAQFDAAICTVSVEYLIHPFKIFREVARVLKPAAPFIVTFSDRWFPPKAIMLWSQLHPFERMALVADYFRHSGEYVNLATESIRGLPRPADDKYADRLTLSDPVFAVRGHRRG